MNRCQNDDCKRPFAPGQIVLVTKIKDTPLVHCCCKECRDAVEGKCAQGDMFPIHQTATFKIDEVRIAGAQLKALPNTIKDGDVHTELRIGIPTGIVSVDKILEFTDRFALTLAKEDIVDYITEPGQGDEEDKIVAALAATLALSEGATDRWAERSKNPMADKELKVVIAEEFGLVGNFTLEGGGKVHFEGGAEPKFWLNVEPTEQPTLSGRDLVKMVRRIIGISKPEKKAVDK